MNTIVEFIKHRILATAIVLAAASLGLEFETGPFGDFVISCIMFAVIWTLASWRKP